MQFYFEMPYNKRLENSKKIVDNIKVSNTIYFIGIGGIGLSGLAKLFYESGKTVIGVDQYENEMTISLKEKGIHIYIGHSEENIKDCEDKFGKIDLVIYSPAVNEDNVEYLFLKKRNIPFLTYGQALSYFINTNPSVSICGTHGKSSTTAMLSELLIEKKTSTSFLCGAVLKKFDTNAKINNNSFLFIAESCEYKETFLNFFPDHVIIPSLEIDHLDYYKNSENYFMAFANFISHIKNGVLIMRLEKDLEYRLFEYAKKLNNISKILTYSENEFNFSESTFNHIHFVYQYNEEEPFLAKVKKISFENNKINKSSVFTLNLPIPSREYAANFLSVYIFLNFLNLIDNNLNSFSNRYYGIKRRFDNIGKDNSGNIIISDYAHHPSEIRTVLKIAKLKFPDKKIWLIFQAHQHSRTRYLLEEFIQLFRNVENIIILPIYKQRDSEEDCLKMSSEIFFLKVKEVNEEARYFIDIDSLFDFLIKNNSNSVYLFVGAGSIDNFARQYIEKMGTSN